MDRAVKILVFAIFFLHVHIESLSSEDDGPIPDKCHPVPELMYRQCCIFPPFFVRTVARECGAVFELKFINEKKVAGLRRNVLTGCDHWKCVLKKYFILSPDGSVDEEKYFLHLDRWVDLNPTFANSMLKAKVNCKQNFRLLMPLSVCEFHSFHSCIRNSIIVNCPDVIQTPQCLELKAFYDECREYFE